MKVHTDLIALTLIAETVEEQVRLSEMGKTDVVVALVERVPMGNFPDPFHAKKLVLHFSPSESGLGED